MKKYKPKPTPPWTPILLLASLLVGLVIGFPLTMQSCYKSKPEIITKEVQITEPFQKEDFLDFIETLPTSATKSNLQVVIGADLGGDSERLYGLLQAYAKMRLDDNKPKAD